MASGRLFADFENDCVNYEHGFIPPSLADTILDQLWRDLRWAQRPIRLFGRMVQQPRLTAWYGDADAVYRYSGITLHPEPWHDTLRGLRYRLEKHLSSPFNSVLANAYRNGNDSMGWHADDEPELGSSPTIASLSLGAERRFLMRHRHSGRISELKPGHGSLLVMKGECQKKYVHSLPKTRKVEELRINLTFRYISPVPEYS
jgi:alkylated DNA repair dioxygenase AlkB